MKVLHKHLYSVSLLTKLELLKLNNTCFGGGAGSMLWKHRTHYDLKIRNMWLSSDSWFRGISITSITNNSNASKRQTYTKGPFVTHPIVHIYFTEKKIKTYHCQISQTDLVYSVRQAARMLW